MFVLVCKRGRVFETLTDRDNFTLAGAASFINHRANRAVSSRREDSSGSKLDILASGRKRMEAREGGRKTEMAVW